MIATLFRTGRSHAGILLALVPFMLLAASGCRSTPKTPSTRLASIIITNRSIAQVEAATEAVFNENGYAGVRNGSGEWVFEKPGTSGNTLVYGDWSGKQVWVRVRVFMRQLIPSADVLLDCNAYMVNEHGDKRFEEEHKLTRMHRGKYQDLLKAVSERLK